MEKEPFLKDKLNSLSKSKFRSSFHLKDKEKEYVKNKGIDVIRKHADDFIEKRLSIRLDNDGSQTPMRGHPVFVAQHATATCCRGCIERWYKINKNTKLTEKQKEFISDLIIKWIEEEMKK